MKKKNRLLRLSLLIALLALFGLGQNAWAATYYSKATGNWTTPGSWALTSGGTALTSGYPVAGDDVIIDAAVTITLDANVVVESIYSTAGTITTGTSSLTTTGDLTIATGGTLNVSGAATITVGGSLVGGGTFTTPANGNWVFNGDGPNFTLPTALTGAVDLTINRPNKKITLAADMAVSDDLIITAGTLATSQFNLTIADAFEGTGTLDARSYTTGTADITISKAQSYTFTGDILGNDANSGNGTTLSIAATAACAITLPESLTNLEDLTINTTAITYTVTLANDLTLSDDVTITTGTLIVGSNTLTVGGTLTVAAAATAGINLTGSTLDVRTAPSISTTGITTTTSTTNLILGAATALPDDITALNNLTISAAAVSTLDANLTLSGNLIFTAAGTLNIQGGATPANRTVTITGDALGTGTINASGTAAPATTTLNLYGDVSPNLTITTSATSITNGTLLVIGNGTTSVPFTQLPNITTNVISLTINRGDDSDIVKLGGALTTLTNAGGGEGNLTVTKGILKVKEGTTLTASGIVSVAADGGIDLRGISGSNATLILGTVSQATSTVTFTNGCEILTNQYSALSFIGEGATSNLPSHVNELYSLKFDQDGQSLTLAGNLKIYQNLDIGSSATCAAATLVTSTYELYVGGTTGIGVGAGAVGTLTATNCGKLTLVGNVSGTVGAVDVLTLSGAKVFISGSLAGWVAGQTTTTSATTEITFESGSTPGTLDAEIVNLYKLILKTANTATIAAGLTIASGGELHIASGATLDLAAITAGVTVNGTFSGSGTLDATDAAGIAVTINGDVKFTGTISTLSHATLGTELTIGNTTTTNFTLPTLSANLETLVINRAGAVVKLSGNLTIGKILAGGLTVTAGTLDLNGYNITLGTLTAAVANVSGIDNIVNNGAAGAYVYLPSTPIANANAAGLGVTGINAGTNAILYVYFDQKTTPGGASTKRYYRLQTTVAQFTAANFGYPTATGSYPTGGTLTVWQSATSNFTAATSPTVTVANPMQASVMAPGIATDLYLTIANTDAVPSAAVIYTDAAGDWSTAGTWLANAVPSTTDEVFVDDVAVTVNSDVTCAKLTISRAGTLTVAAGKTLTVTGNIESAGGTANAIDLTAEGAKLVVGGTLPTGVNVIYTDASSIITLNGNTSMSIPAGITTVHTLNIEKTGGATVSHEAGATTFTVAGSSTLNVTSGTYTVGDVNLTVTGTTNVASGATLDATATAANCAITFNGEVAGAGTIIINGTNAGSLRTLNINNKWSFTGTLTTNEYTKVDIAGNSTHGNITFPSSVDYLALLEIDPTSSRTLTLGGNLVVSSGAALAAADAGLNIGTSGTLNTGNYNITFSSTTGSATELTNAGTLTSGGSTFTFYDDSYITGTGTYNTSNTSFDFSSTHVAWSLPTTLTAMKNLTLNTANLNTITTAADLTVNGQLYLTAGKNLTVGNTFDLTVVGTTNIDATATLDADGGAGTIVTLNGPIVGFGLFATAAANTSLAIGGSGTISGTLPALVAGLYDFTMNRPGETLTYNAIANTLTINNNMTVTAGTFALGDNNLTMNATDKTLEIGSSGVLDMSNVDLTASRNLYINGTLNCLGIIKAEGENAAVIRTIRLGDGAGAGGVFNFSGTLNTNEYTTLNVDGTTASGDFTLPTSVTKLFQLDINPAAIRVITLAGDLRLYNTTNDAALTMSTAGKLVVGSGNTLTLDARYTGAASTTLDATYGEVIFNKAAIFTAGTFSANNATDLTFKNAVTAFPSSITELKSLTVQDAGAPTLTLTGDLSLEGNLTINSNGRLVAGDKSLTVKGDIINNDFVDFSGMSTSEKLTLQGQYISDGAATNTTDASVILEVTGDGDALVMPTSFPGPLFKIKLDRENGMILNSDLTLGAAGSYLVLEIVEGDFDINGHNVTLADDDNYITEAGGATIVNTGTDGAYVTTATAGSTAAKIYNSGIGVTNIDGTVAPTTIVVRRYPMPKTITGVNISINRYYYVSFAGGGSLTALTLGYDNTELGTNSAGNLKIYKSTNALFLSALDSAYTSTSTPGTSTGIVAVNTTSGNGSAAFTNTTAATGQYFTLASTSGAAGTVKVFMNTTGDNKWETAGNWSPSGVPTKDDDVTIGAFDVVLTGNGLSYYARSLTLAAPSSRIYPYSTSLGGDTVTMNIMGNLSINYNGGSYQSVNLFGRINTVIGDGATAVSSTLRPGQSSAPLGQDYSTSNGILFNDLTIKTAAVQYSGDYQIRTAGDFAVQGTSIFEPATAGSGTFVFHGGLTGTQNLDVVSTSAATFTNLLLDNNANVVTSSNFTIVEGIKLAGLNDKFTATNGIATFQPVLLTTVKPWDVFDGAMLKLWDVDLVMRTATLAPEGDLQLLGDLTISGSSGTFNHTTNGGEVIFAGTSLQNLTNAADANEVTFETVRVNTSASVATSSSFYIDKELDVKTSAEFKADNGTIYFVNTAVPSEIKNASTQTLEFNNIIINDVTTTNDSWTVKGNFTLDNAAASFLANNGTITFDNVSEKVIAIDNGLSLGFFEISIADGSKVTTDESFTIANNTTYPTGAGIEVLGTGNFEAESGTITFATTSNPGAGAPKVISKATDGTLILFNVEISNLANNDVTTSTNFEIASTGATVFNNLNNGLGGKFYATAGTVTFTGTAPEIASSFPGATKFYNLQADDAALTLDADDNIEIIGNLSVDGTSGSFVTDDPTNANGSVKFNGTTQQKITGTTSVANPVEIARLDINKTADTESDSEVLLEVNLDIKDDVDADLLLTKGYLNLGSKTLTLGGGDVSYSPFGAINGATGTVKIENTPNSIIFSDVLFKPAGYTTSTLYNLTLEDVLTLDGNLLVNNDLALNMTASNDFDISTYTLTLYGDLSRTTGEFAAATGRLVLSGTGTTASLSNSYFTGSTVGVNLTVGRGEELGANLTMGAKDLTIDAGINYLSLGAYTLDLTSATSINKVSGSIYTGTSSTVKWATAVTTMPANIFSNDQVNNLTLPAALTLAGDLEILGTLSGLFNITTGDNTLTFGPSANIPAYNSATYIIGNLRRTVKSGTPTYFNIGSSAAYRPLALAFATSGNSQVVKVSSTTIDPTYGRVGNPDKAVDILWTIDPEGTSPNDSVKVIFQWSTAAEGSGQSALANSSFPAKWMTTYWKDYRNNLSAFTAPSPRILTMNPYPVLASELEGEWAVFNAASTSNTDKDKAISNTENKVVILSINPNPVQANKPFKVTVQLQDKYNQPITVTSPFYITVTNVLGTGTLASAITGVIPSGSSMVELLGQYTGNALTDNMIKADTTGGSVNWQPTISALFAVLAEDEPTQATGITISNITSTSASFTWNNVTKSLLVLKADTLLVEGMEYPIDGTTYLANKLFGAGTALGNAVVIHNAASGSSNVYGLAPNTTYYAYVFNYAGTSGNENYKLTPASGNPKPFTTSGSYDDDVTYGSNNTRATSKTIGTNTPVTATLGSSSDEDWFNFTVTNVSPNVRAQIYDLPGNYTLEVYDMTGRRIRRSTLNSMANEAAVINDLPSGTYTVRIFSQDGSYYTRSGEEYTLKVSTFGSEIYAVTP